MSFPKYCADGMIIGGDWDAITRTVLRFGGATAVVGFAVNLTNRENYWYCDGTADDVQIQAAVDYVQALGGGTVMLEAGAYDITAAVNLPGSLRLLGQIPGYSTHDGTRLNLANGANCVMIDTKAEEGGFSQIVTLENIWFYGNAANQVGNWDIVDFANARESYIERCYIHSGSRDGFSGRGTVLHRCKIMSNYRYGANLITDCHIEFSHVSGNVADVAYDAGTSGQIFSDSGANKIISNHVHTSPYGSGIVLNGTVLDIVTGNTVTLSDWYGISVNSDDSIVSDNIVYNNSQRAVGSVHNIIVTGGTGGNLISDNMCFDDQGTETTDTGIFLNNTDDNIITGNRCWGHTDYGINVFTDTCNNNLIKDNRLLGNGVACINDAGTDTMLATKTLSFVDGSLMLGAAAPFGWEIDAATEYAMALGVLPLEVQQVVRWKIWATTLVLEADAMRLEIEGYGGASNEPYTTENVAVADHPSETTNFAANDVIYWLLDATDDADIGDMVGGDQVMIKVLHEIAGGADCATDAAFTCVEIEYV